MITISANKTAKEIEQLTAELKYWHGIFGSSPANSSEEAVAELNHREIYNKLSNMITCRDCKYCEPPKRPYQLISCSKLLTVGTNAGICFCGLFEPKIKINHRFQMF